MLFELMQQEVRATRARLAIATGLSGATHAGVVFVVHAGARSEESVAHLFLTVCAACILSALAFREGSRLVSQLFEAAVYRLRVRIAKKIRRAQLPLVEQTGRTEIYTCLTSESSLVSKVAPSVALALHSLSMLAMPLVGIAWLSPLAAVLTAIVYGGGGTIYFFRRSRAKNIIRTDLANQRDLFGVLTDLIQGYKEIRLRAQRGDALMDDIRTMAAALQVAPTQANLLNQENSAFARQFLYVLLVILVFVLPRVTPLPLESMDILGVVAIFMFVPLSTATRKSVTTKADTAAPGRVCSGPNSKNR